MIEAVNSAIANAPLLRGNVDQGSAARNAASQARAPISESLPQAPFVSPFIFVDVNFDTAVIQLRDSDTGEVVEQIPSPRRLAAQQRTEVSQNAEAVAQQAASTPQAEQTALVQASAVEAQAAAQAFSQAAATSSLGTTAGNAGGTTVFA